MIVSNIKATVLVASTYEKKNDNGAPSGILAGKLIVLVDAVKENVSTGEILEFFTGRDFVGDVGMLNTLNRYDDILVDFNLAEFSGKSIKKLVDIKLV